MKERPIQPLSTEVRAILDSSKTQIRRVVAHEHIAEVDIFSRSADEHGRWEFGVAGEGGVFAHGDFVRCPYGVPGDRLWVRETWRTAKCFDDKSATKIAAMAAEAGYERCWAPASFADGTDSGGIRDFGGEWGRIRPSIHMPRWASRITLEVTEVRVQRLQNISGEDAAAEGISVPRCDCEVCLRSSAMCPADASANILEFASLWDSINGKRAPWSSNPWVWAVTFRRLP